MASSKKWETMPLSQTPPSSRSGILAPNSSPINLIEAQPEEDEEDSTAKNRVIENRSGQKYMNNLVNNVIHMAKMNPSKFSSKELVCQQIVKDMKRKRSFNFVIEDLRCEFRKVADLFGCPVTEVQNEISRLLDEQERKKGEHESKEVSYQWEDYKMDALITEEIRIVKEGKGKIKANTLTRHQCVVRIWTKVKRAEISVPLKPHHFEAVAKFFNCPVSEVTVEWKKKLQTKRIFFQIESDYFKLFVSLRNSIEISHFELQLLRNRQLKTREKSNFEHFYC
ncbi:unnamed protein product [Caenorhabditis brenneri]